MSGQTITTTLEALLNAEAALHRVLGVKLDAKTRYHAVKLAKLVTAETTHFNEERNALVKEFGTEREPTAAEKARNGPAMVTEVLPTSPQFPEFYRRVRELLAVEAPIAWGPLTAQMLEPYTDVTGHDLIELGPLYELEPVTT